MQRGHLIANRFSGSGSLINIVNQYIDVNQIDVKGIESRIAAALRTNREIIYEVRAQYRSSATVDLHRRHRRQRLRLLRQHQKRAAGRQGRA
ncbi:DNA/RNA non-specific endonuclease [Amycolatopsis sp. WGS_07]|uniref:DNA/RNA non-specific endonuclease n=1 Tax=Amycolatopsis sp. WGS_07 TaxID=3076764 RepID=UPI003873188C